MGPTKVPSGRLGGVLAAVAGKGKAHLPIRPPLALKRPPTKSLGPVIVDCGVWAVQIVTCEGNPFGIMIDGEGEGEAVAQSQRLGGQNGGLWLQLSLHHEVIPPWIPVQEIADKAKPMRVEASTTQQSIFRFLRNLKFL